MTAHAAHAHAVMVHAVVDAAEAVHAAAHVMHIVHLRVEERVGALQVAAAAHVAHVAHAAVHAAIEAAEAAHAGVHAAAHLVVVVAVVVDEVLLAECVADVKLVLLEYQVLLLQTQHLGRVVLAVVRHKSITVVFYVVVVFLHILLIS